jgi:hypothetical protein
MLVSDITRKDLQEMLNTCVNGQIGSSQHGYLGMKKVDEKTTYVHAFASQEKLDKTDYQKMSISNIQNLACIVIGKDQETPASNTLLQSIHQIAKNRDCKMNTVAKKIGRFVLSVLKYVLFASFIGIPIGLMIQKQQAKWDRIETQTNNLLYATSSADREIEKVVKDCSSKQTQAKALKAVSGDLREDLVGRLSAEKIKEFVDLNDKEKTPVVLDSLRRDHTRDCIAYYYLEDEETGCIQTISPFSEDKETDNGIAHFGNIIQKIEGFNEQGDLEEYSPYIQALMCQNILQGFMYKAKAELLGGGWQEPLKDLRKNVSPDFRDQQPCEEGMGHVKLSVKKAKGDKLRTIHVEGTIKLQSNLVSSRAPDINSKYPLDFEEPSRFLTARISFDLHPENTETGEFKVSGFSTHLTFDQQDK